MKKIVSVLCMSALLLAGCGEKAAPPVESTATPEPVAKYTETDFTALPDEGFVLRDNLTVTSIERNMEGKPTMYCMESGMDDTENPYAQVLQYTLEGDQGWEMEVIGQKSLAKRVRQAAKAGATSFQMPFIHRGDDGNLYGLLKVAKGEDEGAASYEYSMLQLEEEEDNFYEVPLEMKASAEGGTDYSKDEIIKFHVMEDGTPMVVFRGGTMLQFDSDSGAQTNVCSPVPDYAMERNVGYGDQEFIYYSATENLFGVLDKDSLTVTGTFGKEIEEEDRGREWCFDTSTEEWQMYAFNTSGLYRISKSANRASATRMSSEGDFASLADATVYDVQVDSQENVYLLIRREAEEASYESQWEFGVVRYDKQKQ